MFLIFSGFEDFFHQCVGDDLVVRPESKRLVQRIGEIGAGVGGNEAITLDLEKIHLPETMNHLTGGELSGQLFL